MSKVEEKALEALDWYAPKGINEQVGLVYTKSAMLGMFKDGYNQAEKDLELGWKDFEIIHKITYDESRNVSLNKGCEISKKEFYQEVLKRFKERKGEVI